MEESCQNVGMPLSFAAEASPYVGTIVFVGVVSAAVFTLVVPIWLAWRRETRDTGETDGEGVDGERRSL